MIVHNFFTLCRSESKKSGEDSREAEDSEQRSHEWKNDPSSGFSNEEEKQSLNLDGGGL